MGTSTRVRPLSRSVKTSTTHQNRTNKTRHKHTREPAPQKIPPHLENLSRPTHFRHRYIRQKREPRERRFSVQPLNRIRCSMRTPPSGGRVIGRECPPVEEVILSGARPQLSPAVDELNPREVEWTPRSSIYRSSPSSQREGESVAQRPNEIGSGA
jgi:hypothetical protein